jgi:cellulose synthase/poly-beta-1,6-N-acetylglucosamine synthase-like glycosyltransferase
MNFSVLIPAFNEERGIQRCLDSILSNNYPKHEYEILVINDGSTDNTADVVSEYVIKFPNIRCVSKKNGGRASALNTGLKLANGEFILVTDADSIVNNEWFNQMAAALDKSDMIQGSCYAVDAKNFWQKIQHARDLLRLKYFKSEAVIGVGANNGFRKSAALAVGGFNENTVHVTTDFIVRLKENGFSVGYDPSILSYTQYPSRPTAIIKQRLRWMEFSPSDAVEWHSPVFILQLLYAYGLSALILLGLLISLYIKSIYPLVVFPFAVTVDFLVFADAFRRMLFSEDRRWVLYFLLYSLFITLTVRILLIPSNIYQIVKPRKKPTFSK